MKFEIKINNKRLQYHHQMLVALFTVTILTGCASARDYAVDYVRRAYNADQQDQPNLTFDYAKKATELDPGYAPGWYWLGVSYVKLEKWNEAILTLDQATKEGLHSAQLKDTYRMLGVSYLKLKKSSEGMQALKKALLVSAKMVSPMEQHMISLPYVIPYIVAGGFLITELCDAEGAVAILEKGLKVSPDNEDLRILLGDAHALKGDASVARKYWGGERHRWFWNI